MTTATDPNKDKAGLDEGLVGSDIENTDQETQDEEVWALILSSRQKGALAASAYLALCGLMLVYTAPPAIQAWSNILSSRALNDTLVRVPISGETVVFKGLGGSFSLKVLEIQPLDFEARFWVSENVTVRAFGMEGVAGVDHFYYSDFGWSVPLTLKNTSASQFRELAYEIGAISEDDEDRDKHPLGMFFKGIQVYNASFSRNLAARMRAKPPVTSFIVIMGGPRENEEAETRAEQLWLNLCPQGRSKEPCIVICSLKGSGGGYLWPGESIDIESGGYYTQFAWLKSVEGTVTFNVEVYQRRIPET